MPETSLKSPFKLDHPPIVEMVVDIDCDLPPDRSLSMIEDEAVASLRDSYPKSEKKFLQQFQIKVAKPGELTPLNQGRTDVEALLFRSSDGLQLTQFRTGGYSFNRLAPYEGMDTYLPEIRRTWENYTSVARPVSLRKIAVRTINRIPLPLNKHGRLNLGKYLATEPRLPKIDGRQIMFTGFMNQHQLKDEGSGQEATIILASQGIKDGNLSLLLDIDAFDRNVEVLNQWEDIEPVIQSLRDLKNSLFVNTLAGACLNQF